MKNYFKKIINEEQGRKFQVYYQWQAPENKLNIYSHRESGFKNSTILAIAFEVELKKSKIEEVGRLKKSNIEEVED
jgi:hypothetical protein